MEIRILNASKMCVDGRYRNGDIVEVYEASDGLLTESESGSGSGYFYSFDWEWQGKYFEIVDGDGWITWTGGERPTPLGTLIEVKHRDGGIYKEPCGECYSQNWHSGGRESPGDIVAYRVVTEDTPQKPLKETVKIHKKADPQYTQGAMLQKHLKQLSELEHAIELHDNKQNKRRQERQKLLEIINESMPKRVKVVVGEYQ
jgi:hypothetical protein|tara:strand:+ start:222 stop:824 length:603 start_codon:yes stop_codon:yes gene_type:complete